MFYRDAGINIKQVIQKEHILAVQHLYAFAVGERNVIDMNKIMSCAGKTGRHQFRGIRER